MQQRACICRLQLTAESLPQNKWSSPCVLVRRRLGGSSRASVVTPLPHPSRPVLQVTVDRPDVQGRIAILKVHSRGKTLAPDVDFEKVARRTPGAPPTLPCQAPMHRFLSEHLLQG